MRKSLLALAIGMILLGACAGPSAPPAPTETPAPTPTPVPTPAPVIGLMTGHVWLRAEPADDSRRLGVILERGQRVEILAVFGDWYQVRWVPQAEAEVIGWVTYQLPSLRASILDSMEELITSSR